jgi:hypothetical protein
MTAVSHRPRPPHRPHRLRRLGTAALVAFTFVVAVDGGLLTSEADPLVTPDHPAVRIPTPAAEDPAWRLDRLAGHPLEIVTPRADVLSDFERRALQAHVERVADRVAPFDWRAHGVRFEIRCLVVDDQPCRIGVARAEPAGTKISLSPSVAFLTDAALEAVVAHELAHAWQFSQLSVRGLGSALVGVDVVLPDGVHLAELEADCLAAIWGHSAPEGSGLIYWSCPSAARLAVATAWRTAPLS